MNQSKQIIKDIEEQLMKSIDLVNDRVTR